MAIPQTLHQVSRRCEPGAPTDRGATPTRAARLSAIVYLVLALAAPLIVYFGPDVLSPTAPLVANAALDGRFALHVQKPAREPRANAARVRPSVR